MSDLTFTKHETYGYGLNGKQFTVAQGKPYTTVADATATGDCCGEKGYLGTKMQILAGMNGNTAKCVYDNRPFTKDVNTGWAPGKGTGLLSDVLALWGMTDVSSNHQDLYVLSMSYDPAKLAAGQSAELAAWSGTKWGKAVDLDSDHGAGRHFVTGPFDAARDFQLGRYGFDPATQTVWAVIDHGATAFGVETSAGTRPMSATSTRRLPRGFCDSRFRRASSGEATAESALRPNGQRAQQGDAAQRRQQIGIGLGGLPGGVELRVGRIEPSLPHREEFYQIGLAGGKEPLHARRLLFDRQHDRDGPRRELLRLVPTRQRRFYLHDHSLLRLLQRDHVAMVFGLALGRQPAVVVPDGDRDC